MVARWATKTGSGTGSFDVKKEARELVKLNTHNIKIQSGLIPSDTWIRWQVHLVCRLQIVGASQPSKPSIKVDKHLRTFLSQKLLRYLSSLLGTIIGCSTLARL